MKPKPLRPVAVCVTAPEPDATSVPPFPSLTPVRISQLALVGVNPESVLMNSPETVQVASGVTGV